MFSLHPLLLSLTLILSVLVPSAFASHEADSYDYGQPWRGQDHSQDQQRHQQEQIDRQQADAYRYRNEQRQRDEQQNWERQEQQRQNRRQQELGADAWKSPQQGHNFGTWPPY